MVKLVKLLSLTLSLLLLAACTTPTPPPPAEAQEPWETAEIFLSFSTAQILSEERLTSLQTSLLEATDGRIYCNAYPDGTMGDDAELLQAVHSGALSVVQASTSVQVTQVPELALLDIPYLFSDPDTCTELLNGPLLDFFQPYYNENGLQLLGWNCPNFRQLTSSVSVTSPSDLQRLNIRILDNKYHRIYWSELGAEPQNLDFSTLFYAIQQGVVNAQENTAGTAISMRFYQMHDYLTMINYLPFINAVVMNKDCYDALSPEDQQTVTQIFAGHANTGGNTLTTDILSSYFTNVSTPSGQLKKALEQGSNAVREALAEDLGQDTLDRFYAVLEN